MHVPSVSVCLCEYKKHVKRAVCSTSCAGTYSVFFSPSELFNRISLCCSSAS